MQDEWQQTISARFDLYLALLCVLLPLTTAAVGLRIWVRLKITRTFDQADVLLIFSHVINTTAAIVWLVIQARQTQYEPRSVELFDALSTAYLAAFVMYALSGALVKLVIAAFFLKIARLKWQRVLIFGPLAAYVIVLVFGVNLVIFRCHLPLNATRILRDGSCPVSSAGIIRMGLAVASINCLCDWIFAIVPLHMLHSAKGLNRASRFSAGCLIGLAVVGSAVSVIRLPYFNALSFTPAFFETCPTPFVLSLIETTVAVTAISLATLKPLLKMIRTGSFHKKSTTQNNDIASPPRRRSQLANTYNMAASQQTSAAKSFYLNSRVMGGIGILPDTTTVSMGSVDDGGDEEEVTYINVQMPKPASTRRYHAPSLTTVPSIGQVLWEYEEGREGVHDEEMGRMAKQPSFTDHNIAFTTRRPTRSRHYHQQNTICQAETLLTDGFGDVASYDTVKSSK
ncbi:hypothetical protein CAC42_6683 [Sphaceloma murrayae]|uniref:Rhodopsin domain-containing protein n=1 Tax=Sphaceloma murrayae TaxID=2082308 RepID=A0A2K1QH08_9PEZI|nr:hypothetical protein CAC42_6683 [Sphaceloma murrayae]